MSSGAGAGVGGVGRDSGLTGNSRKIGLIWAQTLEGVIGRDGSMPWDVPEDLAHFKTTTAGHPVIMGRRTWESFPARFRPLPGRTNIVISGDPQQRQLLDEAGAVAVDNPELALERAAECEGDEIWVIGGAQIFEVVLNQATVAAVTIIDVDESGDTFAPVLDDAWVRSSSDPSEGWHTSRRGAKYRIEQWNRRDREIS